LEAVHTAGGSLELEGEWEIKRIMVSMVRREVRAGRRMVARMGSRIGRENGVKAGLVPS